MKRFVLAALFLSSPAFAVVDPPATRQPVIVFLGDSLSEGYGVKPSEAYPALIKEMIAERGWDFSVENQSRSGDTATEALGRASARLEEPIDVLVLALGTNDALQRLPHAKLEKSLRRIIEKTYTVNKRARIVILGARMPLELGRDARRFNDVYRRLAWEYRTAYLPFLLEGVINVPSLTLADRIHPNPDGHQRLAEHVWSVLEPVLKRYFPRQAAAPAASPK